MPSVRRLRWMPSLLGTLALLVGIVAGSTAPEGGEQFSQRSATAITAAGYLSPSTGAPDTRLHREVESRQGQRISRHDGAPAAATSTPPVGARVEALAGLLERAGHPERAGHILLRGPPATSA